MEGRIRQTEPKRQERRFVPFPPSIVTVQLDALQRSLSNIMNRFPIYVALLTACFLFIAADGCSSDPNVEGAKLDLRNKQYDRALENLDIALSNTPDNAEALELKGRVLSEMAFETIDVTEHVALIARMLEAYGRVPRLDPTKTETVLLALRLAYQSEFQRGVQAFNRGRSQESEYNASASYFGAAATIQPDSAGAYVNQAFALMNANRMNDAMGPFEMAIEKGDHELDTYRFLASIYQTSDRPGDAVNLLEEASTMYPNDEVLQTELLNAYQVAGESERALAMYAQAVETNPDNKLFRYNYGSLLVEDNRFDEAIVQLQKALEIDPDYGNAHYNLGAAYINQAVILNIHVNELDDQLRANRSNMTADQIRDADVEIMRQADARTALFSDAIAPLEKARELFEAAGEDSGDVCRALFQSYVQTNQTDAAQTVSACAGFDDTSSGN